MADPRVALTDQQAYVAARASPRRARLQPNRHDRRRGVPTGATRYPYPVPWVRGDSDHLQWQEPLGTPASWYAQQQTWDAQQAARHADWPTITLGPPPTTRGSTSLYWAGEIPPFRVTVQVIPDTEGWGDGRDDFGTLYPGMDGPRSRSDWPGRKQRDGHWASADREDVFDVPPQMRERHFGGHVDYRFFWADNTTVHETRRYYRQHGMARAEAYRLARDQALQDLHALLDDGRTQSYLVCATVLLDDVELAHASVGGCIIMGDEDDPRNQAYFVDTAGEEITEALDEARTRLRQLVQRHLVLFGDLVQAAGVLPTP